MKLTKINNQYELILPDHRAMRPEWKTGWEVKRIDSMVANLDEKDVLFYIGAEVGDIPALVLKYTDCDMVLFEPNRKAYPNHAAIREANKLKAPLYVFPGFASDKSNFENDWVSLSDDWEHDKIIPDHGFCQLYDPGTIAQITIDDFCEKTKIIPTAITLDVEGSEAKVLKGAEETLKKYKPKIWLSAHPEFMVIHYNQWLAELREYLILLGYKETLLDYEKHELHFYYE